MRSQKQSVPAVDLSELPPTLNLQEAARVLHCSTRTVMRRIAAGQLPALDNGGRRVIILRRDLEALIGGAQ